MLSRQPGGNPVSTRRLTTLFALCTLFGAAAAPGQDRAPSPHLIARPAALDFGTVVQGASASAELTLNNDGSEPVRIARVLLVPPLVVTAMPTEVPPHQRATITVSIESSRYLGPVEGELRVQTDRPDVSDLVVDVRGRVVRTVDAEPRPAFFVATPRDSVAEASIDIVNYGHDPVTVGPLEYGSQRYTLAMSPIEAGRRFRLTLRTREGAPAGRQTERIFIHTSSPTVPVLPIVVNTFLREKVYTFPDSVDMGDLALAELTAASDAPTRLAQTLMVYKPTSHDFGVKVASAAAWLDVRATQGPLGDRWQLTLTLVPEKLTPGPIETSLVLETNDSDFPHVIVPVKGNIRGR